MGVSEVKNNLRFSKQGAQTHTFKRGIFYSGSLSEQYQE